MKLIDFCSVVSVSGSVWGSFVDLEKGHFLGLSAGLNNSFNCRRAQSATTPGPGSFVRGLHRVQPLAGGVWEPCDS
jgi:hypothetical protein